MRRAHLITLFAVGVLVIWGLVVLVSLITDKYAPLTAITPVMLIVTGFLFGKRDEISKNGKDAE